MKILDRRRFIFDASGTPVRNLDAPPLETNSSLGSFANAMTSRDRGYVYLPTMESKLEVDAWSRVELNKRARFYYNNGGGLISRLVDGVARMVVGTGLIPHPTPTRVTGRTQKIREWSHHVRNLYMQRCGNAKTYDMAQRRNVFQDTRANMRCKIVDGDSMKVLVRDAASGRLRRIRYEANQIGNGKLSGAESDRRWYDGILCGRHNEMLKARINTTDHNNVISSVDIPAENVLHSLNDERINQVRGLTRFHRIAHKVQDRGEILAAITKGIKTTQQIAYVIEQQASTQKVIPGSPGTTLPVKPTRHVETASGKKVSLEEFLGGGEAWGLAAGQQFKMVQAQNPSTNVTEYLKDMVRDACWAIGVAPEIAWNIIEAGGANMRFIQADFGQMVEVEQDDLVDQDLGPDYIAWLWDMIEAGEIEEIDGWEKHVWISPARLTVDFGRDGKLYIEELKRGIRTMQSMYGMRGEIAEVGIDTYLDERQFTIQGIYDRMITVNGVTRPMTFEEAFPEIRQQSMQDPSNPDAETTQQQQEETQARLETMETKLLSLAHAIDFARQPKS
jgi:capsid protein